jgi:hypothetical protein
MHSSVSQARSAHRFAIFVKICIADAPIARARGGASCVPPAIETCAPRRTSSSQTGATQAGSFALSVFGLNAGLFFETRFAFAGWTFAAAFRFETGDFVTRRFFFVDAVRFCFVAVFFFDALVRFDTTFLPAMQPLAIQDTES